MIEKLKTLFDSNPINTSRQVEVDLSRGFTAILIIVCHVGLYLGDNSDVALYTFSDIIGSEFGAPVFMSLMGLSIAYSKHQSPKDMVLRFANLFIGGYLLSVYRTILPRIILGNINEWTEIEAFFVVDIMQFAGLSFLLLALFKKMKLPTWIILIISIGMVGVEQLATPTIKTLINNEWAAYFVNLFFPVTEWSCFPLFIWFFFPVFGLCFGELLIRCKNKNLLYGLLMPLSLCGVLYVYWQFHKLYPDYTSYYYGHNFYYMGTRNVLLNALFITFSLSFWYFINKIIPEFIRRFFQFLSSNLNTYYVLTWIFIATLIHVFAMFGLVLSAPWAFAMMILLLTLCTLSTKAIIGIKVRLKRRT